MSLLAGVFVNEGYVKISVFCELDTQTVIVINPIEFLQCAFEIFDWCEKLAGNAFFQELVVKVNVL